MLLLDLFFFQKFSDAMMTVFLQLYFLCFSIFLFSMYSKIWRTFPGRICTRLWCGGIEIYLARKRKEEGLAEQRQVSETYFQIEFCATRDTSLRQRTHFLSFIFLFPLPSASQNANEKKVEEEELPTFFESSLSCVSDHPGHLSIVVSFNLPISRPFF